MNDPVKSISTIRNFMGNAGRNTCNDYLYEALQDAVEALEKQIPEKEIIKVTDADIKVGRVLFKAGTKVHYCPDCGISATGSENYCRRCGKALIY